LLYNDPKGSKVIFCMFTCINMTLEPAKHEQAARIGRIANVSRIAGARSAKQSVGIMEGPSGSWRDRRDHGGSVGIMIGSVRIMKGSVGIMKGSVGIMKGGTSHKRYRIKNPGSQR